MSENYDAIIVGAGPAGLSAALILGRCRRRVLLCDTGLQRNLASKMVHGLLGHEGSSPRDYLAKGRSEIAKYATVTVREIEVTDITIDAGMFTVFSKGKQIAKASKILLATGLVDQLPNISGIEAFYGLSVHHCPYCDGFEYSDLPIAIYGTGDKGAGLALMMKQWSANIILCTDGDCAISPDLAVRLAHHDIRTFLAGISRLEGTPEGSLTQIVFLDGATVACSALFFTTGCDQGSQLSRHLGCARDEKGSIITHPQTEETTVPGVYVAGDASKDVLFVSVAVAEGAKAAVAINRALLKRDGLT